MSEYVIINKTEILKRIEELERLYKNSEKPSIQGTIYNQLSIELKQILSQSTPLIPEIENAFTKGERYGWDTQKLIGNIEQMKEKIKFQSLQDYISNLKLDI